MSELSKCMEKLSQDLTNVSQDLAKDSQGFSQGDLIRRQEAINAMCKAFFVNEMCGRDCEHCYLNGK